MKRFIGLLLSLIFLGGIIFYGIINKYFIRTDEIIYYFILVSAVIFVIVMISVIFNLSRTNKIKSLETRLTAWSSLSYHVNKIGDQAFNELPIGIILYERNNHTVKWHNKFTETVFGMQKLENIGLLELNKDLTQLLEDEVGTQTLKINDKMYDVLHNAHNQVLYFFDETEREDIKDKYTKRATALGVIYLDNVEEALHSFDIYEKSNIRGEYLGVLTDWISEHRGFLRLYTEDKMVVSLHYEELERMMADKFEVLNKIREISTKHRIRVSASIGIACYDVDFEELGSLAQNAIELAEKRGGDQAVVNIQNEKIKYFGGQTNASEKSSRVHVRVQTQNFKDLIESSKNVITVAHKQSDIDALGAMIGVYRLSEASGIPARMVCDPDEIDGTVKKIIPDLKQESKTIHNNIITTKEALKLIDEDTLLVVVDTQSPQIIASPQLLEKASKIAVIDHHRQGEDAFDGVFLYVEPYASSSVELVAEMMEFYPKEVHLEPIEASIMYGGILVDTNEFSYRTGSRTFGAAGYLKEQQASSAKVKEWLRQDKQRTLLINELVSKIVMVEDGFGVVVDDTDYIRDRVLLAQVSERILDIDNINAGFTIARVGERMVGISARSYDRVNVQLIMEELGGGGHLNSAATQINDKTVDEVFEMLKIILIREASEGGEPMKVILLEEVKSKGQKDDIVDVPNGYGQYLLSSNKAILATPEAIKEVELKKARLIEQERQHLLLMQKLKEEIESKSVNISINIGQDGKMFGSVTTKLITDAFAEQNGIELDRKKVELTSEINSIGIYTATVMLAKDIKAQFEINVIEK